MRQGLIVRVHAKAKVQMPELAKRLVDLSVSFRLLCPHGRLEANPPATCTCSRHIRSGVHQSREPSQTLRLATNPWIAQEICQRLQHRFSQQHRSVVLEGEGKEFLMLLTSCAKLGCSIMFNPFLVQETDASICQDHPSHGNEPPNMDHTMMIRNSETPKPCEPTRVFQRPSGAEHH